MQLFRDYSPLKLNPACNQIFRRYDSTTYLSKKKIENEFKEFENSKNTKKNTPIYGIDPTTTGGGVLRVASWRCCAVVGVVVVVGKQRAERRGALMEQ